jgi:putative FmdB family regulatory protein
MPIYEYGCEKCGEVTELLVFGKEETPVCKGCGSTDVVKLMSAHNTNAGIGPSPADCAGCGSHQQCGASGASCGGPGSCCGG